MIAVVEPVLPPWAILIVAALVMYALYKNANNDRDS